ncbi:MAG: efflux RND transporter periplasmic adaptor subunit [Bacteroidota bacterium]
MTASLTPSRRASLLTLTVLLIASACSAPDEASSSSAEPAASASEASEKRSVRVHALTLEPTSFEDVIELTGTVEAPDDATLAAQTAGEITSLAGLGQFVAAGQAVARIDATLAEAAVAQAQATVDAARAQFELAEDNLKRQEPLFRDSIISALEIQNVRTQAASARAQVAQAEAVLAQAQKQVRNAVVTAPFGGTVEEHFTELGEIAAPGGPVARIVNTSRVKVRVGVPERYANDVQVGTPVEMNFKAYGGTTYTGNVTFSGSVINPLNRTFPVEIALNNSNRQIKPEMVARVFVTRASFEDALVLPQSAVVRDELGNGVFIAKQEGDRIVAERRNVSIGASYGGRLVVTSGLSAGDEVIVQGQTNLIGGDALNIIEYYGSVEEAMLPVASSTAP